METEARVVRPKRVLLFSHNALSDTKNNGKTLTAIFSGWPREALAQLYLTAEMPSFSVCGNFFRVTDAAAMRAFFRREKAEGTVVTGQPGEETAAPSAVVREGESQRLRSLLANHLPLPEWIRDLFWRGGRYQSEGLLAWLDAFAPEAVFFQGSNYPFAYDVAHWICRRYGAKLILQLTDDYTYVPHPVLPLSWHNHFRYMRRFRQALKRADWVYAIGPAMREEYARWFGCGRVSVAANCVEISPYASENNARGDDEKTPLRFLYAGSVHTGRWRMLLRLAEAMRELRAEGRYASLEVYTPSALPPHLAAKLRMEPELAYRGSLTPSQLRQAMSQANVLVMAEAVGRAARRATRLSLSTKIPEYMAAGRCILAAGPLEASSIRYIREREAGVAVDGSRRSDLLRGLREVFDERRRFAMVQNAMRVAQTHHAREVLQAEIYRQIQK